VDEDWLEFVQPGKIRLAGEIPISTIVCESTRPSAVDEDWLEFVQHGKIRLAGEIPISTIV